MSEVKLITNETLIVELQAATEIPTGQLHAAVNLMADGNTIPFIARYRKDQTGGLTDDELRLIEREWERIQKIANRRKDILRLLEEQGQLTDALKNSLAAATSVSELDDIYRPFRPKRRTRATIAREKGLTPLAEQICRNANSAELEKQINLLMSQNPTELDTAEDCISGALDIIAEDLSDDPQIRQSLKRKLPRHAALTSVLKKDADEHSPYQNYADYRVVPSRIKGYQMLALKRGEREGHLKLGLETIDEEYAAQIDHIAKKIKYWSAETNPYINELRQRCTIDSWKRLIKPSLETELQNILLDAAEAEALDIFSENLKNILLAPPLRDHTVLAFDPGYRNGCKLAATDKNGDVLATAVIYPVPPQSKKAESMAILDDFVSTYPITVLALGNGTATRETEAFIQEWQDSRSGTPGISKERKRLPLVIVNEAGASVYSASAVGAREFPDMPVELRSAVSIARRLQDPLAELVKIDPSAIGVGQYQHDINAKQLASRLGNVVEDCVNRVGTDLNSASPSLLSYIAGISPRTAENIYNFRQSKGQFTNRKELLNVKGLGPKTFEQCAGFLRISLGDEPLDNTSIHPESYDTCYQLLELLFGPKDQENVLALLKQGRGVDISGQIKDKDPDMICRKLDISSRALQDLTDDLNKAGRDGRADFALPSRSANINNIEDLREGMILQGIVRNVVQFGAFVDIGVHRDGLVHISEMADHFVSDPTEEVYAGQSVKVRVISVDLARGQISLSMKI